jgi:hypothetical protein
MICLYSFQNPWLYLVTYSVPLLVNLWPGNEPGALFHISVLPFFACWLPSVHKHLQSVPFFLKKVKKPQQIILITTSIWCIIISVFCSYTKVHQRSLSIFYFSSFYSQFWLPPNQALYILKEKSVEAINPVLIQILCYLCILDVNALTDIYDRQPFSHIL